MSGYEELANDDGDSTAATGEDATAHDETGEYTPQRPSSRGNDTTTVTDDSSSYELRRGVEDSILSDGDGTLTGSTPRPPATKSLSMRPQFANLGSPYERLRQEMKNEMAAQGGTGRPGAAEEDEEEDTEILFQQHTSRLPDMSMTPKERDRDDTDQFEQVGTSRTNKDPLMHRVLDKNYRLMATPHKGAGTGVSPLRWKITEKKDDGQGKGKEKAHNVPIWEDSPMSSPEMEVPKLRSAAFMSPIRAGYKSRIAAATAASGAPRTPGVSVQTPATARKTRDVYQETPGASTRVTDEITWESDSDEDIYAGMSPPKTINFALPPSKLLQTPGTKEKNLA